MTSSMSIQEANVNRLREIDPERVYVEKVRVLATQPCQEDYLHGKGVCHLLPRFGHSVDVLCMECSVKIIEMWLAFPEIHVTAVVAQ